MQNPAVSIIQVGNIKKSKMHSFTAVLDIIEINPFVFIPEHILSQIFLSAGKEKSPLPVKGSINNIPYRQTLMRYKGAWRLYINAAMLKNSPKRIGELINVELAYDEGERNIAMPETLSEALGKNKKAKAVFDSLIPSRQKEIVRYIASLKTEKAIHKNIKKVIGFLNGNNAFAGRERP